LFFLFSENILNVVTYALPQMKPFLTTAYTIYKSLDADANKVVFCKLTSSLLGYGLTLVNIFTNKGLQFDSAEFNGTRLNVGTYMYRCN
jgi:hypothetical protein